MLAFILPHELFKTLNARGVFFPLTEGNDFPRDFINICRGQLLAAFFYNDVLNIILLDGLFATLLSFGIVALVIVIGLARVGISLDPGHHVTAVTAK